MNNSLAAILQQSTQFHGHLCPRQVLGVRIALAGASAHYLDIPREDKKLIVIAEADGCFLSGLMAATGVSVNKRTLRIEDYGKIAATFVDATSEKAVRVAPQPNIRQHAWAYAKPNETRRYQAMLLGYQAMPDNHLLRIEEVALKQSIASIMSRAGIRTVCDVCLEEIINEREVQQGSRTLCIPCAEDGYYTSQQHALPTVCDAKDQ